MDADEDGLGINDIINLIVFFFAYVYPRSSAVIDSLSDNSRDGCITFWRSRGAYGFGHFVFGGLGDHVF